MPDKDDTKSRTARPRRQARRSASAEERPARAAAELPELSRAQIEAKREQLRRKFH